MANHNRVQCNKCKSVIESKHRHDFVTCKCGHVSVDGGNDYHKRCWKGEPDFTEMPTDNPNMKKTKGIRRKKGEYQNQMMELFEKLNKIKKMK